MDGVTILTEVSVRGTDLLTVCAGWLGSAVFVIGFFRAIIELCRLQPNIWLKLLSVVSITMTYGVLSMIILGLTYNNHVEYQTFYTEYTVIVDDSVGFNEFYNHYEIISQDGDIYTVREAGE